MSAIFLNDWAMLTSEALAQLFDLNSADLANLQLMIASYARNSDSGYAFILFKDSQNQLFEVNASHDSVVDFKGQWQPEDTSAAALYFRMERGQLGRDSAGNNLFADELRQCLESEEQQP